MGSVIAVVGLALLDSLSLGTLVIPLALILHWIAAIVGIFMVAHSVAVLRGDL